MTGVSLKKKFVNLKNILPPTQNPAGTDFGQNEQNGETHGSQNGYREMETGQPQRHGGRSAAEPQPKKKRA